MALTTNLISYWKCDENTGSTASDSVGGNTASLAGTTPLWTPGIIGSAIAADGTDNQATITNPTNLGGLSAVTVSLWFNSVRTVGIYQKLFFLNNVWDIGINNDGKIFWENSIDNPGVVSNTVYSDSNPHHLVITYDGTTDLTYIDNIVVNTTTSAGGSLAATSGNNLYFAARDGGEWLDGWIDEIGYWSRALSSTEVSQLYNSGAGLQYPFVSSTSSGNMLLMFRP